MKCLTPTDTEAPVVIATNDIRLPMGLLGFEQLKDYLLLSNPEEEPFQWLRVKDDASLAFIVINPFLIVPGYQPDVPQSDIDFLGIKNPDDAALYNIVTLHGPGRATVNLKGPIVVNRHTLVGKQVVLANAAEYSVQHPLPVDETAV